jgi:hypothetical protein
MSQAHYLRAQVDALARLSRNVKEPEMSGKLEEIADELRIMASVAYVVNLAAALDKNSGAKVSNLIRTEAPLSTAFGVTRLGTFKVNGRHRIRAQYGRVSLPGDATDTPGASC